VTEIKMDTITGNITHIGGKKLLVPISMIEWTKANQEYARICSEYIDATYLAQEKWTESSTSSDLLRLVKQFSGKEILERLQEDKGFNLVIVKPTEKWEEPGYEEPKTEGTVDLNNLRRVEIVAIATNLLKKRIGKRPVETTKQRRDCAIALKSLELKCRLELTFMTTTNTRVKGVKGSDHDWETQNVDEYYIENIPDILRQEGWKTYGTLDTFIPDVNSHPFWEMSK